MAPRPIVENIELDCGISQRPISLKYQRKRKVQWTLMQKLWMKIINENQIYYNPQNIKLKCEGSLDHNLQNNCIPWRRKIIFSKVLLIYTIFVICFIFPIFGSTSLVPILFFHHTSTIWNSKHKHYTWLLNK